MALDSKVKKSWEEIQKKYDVPVNAIGVKIGERDKEMLRIWKEEGLDKFVKR